MLSDGAFSDDVSLWPRSISCDLLSLPTGGQTNILVRLPPTDMVDIFKRGAASWRIAEVERTGEDPAAAILSNQGNHLLLQLYFRWLWQGQMQHNCIKPVVLSDNYSWCTLIIIYYVSEKLREHSATRFMGIGVTTEAERGLGPKIVDFYAAANEVQLLHPKIRLFCLFYRVDHIHNHSSLHFL